MKNKLIIIVLLMLSCIPAKGVSQELSDYLMLEDIGPYKLEAPEKVVGGHIGGARVFKGAGPIAPTGHFYLDHIDRTYEAYYLGGKDLCSPKVQVTQHAGSDSDKWLLHEVERGFRGSDDEKGRLGLLHRGSRLVEISNNKVFRFWSIYRWVSNQVVVVIDYGDARKPEPLEVVQAYLQKFPSTIPTTLVLDRDHDEKWVKDEMERRLWLCDKWFLHLQMAKAEENETLRTLVKYLAVFVDYREKYYGIKGRDEKSALSRYLTAKDGTAIKNKLTEYKTWWSVNKTKSINLP
jgi:hypothetical protein